jgi:hypothetical protein
VSRLSSKCENLDFSQPHGPPWLVTGKALAFFFLNVKAKRFSEKSVEFQRIVAMYPTRENSSGLQYASYALIFVMKNVNSKTSDVRLKLICCIYAYELLHRLPWGS